MMHIARKVKSAASIDIIYFGKRIEDREGQNPNVEKRGMT